MSSEFLASLILENTTGDLLNNVSINQNPYNICWVICRQLADWWFIL